jgi:hypothetical protein
MNHDYHSYFVLMTFFCTVLLLIITIAMQEGVMDPRPLCQCNSTIGYMDERWDTRNLPDTAPSGLNLTPLYKEI